MKDELLSAVPAKNNRTCAGCYAYEDGLGLFSGGVCKLGFAVKQIPKGERKATQYGKGKTWIVTRCKPAEPCTKPMTERDEVIQFRLRHYT